MTATFPERWKKSRLGDVLPLSYGKGLPQRARVEGPYEVLGSNGVVGSHTAALTEGAALVVGRKGAAGAVYFARSPAWIIDTAYYTQGTDAIDLAYGYHLLTWLRLGSLDRSTAIPSLGRDDYSSIEVGLPELPEQRAITAKVDELFSDLDAGIAALERAKANLARYRAAVISAGVEGRLTGYWRQRNVAVTSGQDAITPAPVTWRKVSLAEAARFQNGRAFPSKEYASSGVKLLRPGNLFADGSVRWTDRNTRCLPQKWEARFPAYLVRGGELVMNLTAQSLADEFLGRVCMTAEGEHCLLNQRLARITPVEGVVARFFLWALKSKMFRRFVDGLNSGSLIQHMFTSDLRTFEFYLPPIDEQQEIVRIVEERLSVIDRVGATIAKQWQHAKHLRQSILAAAFAGRLPTGEVATA